MADSTTFKSRLVGLQSNLMNFAVQLTSDRDAARDLVQDTTLRVLDNAEKYHDNVNFKGWVFTIMRNIFINNYRRQVRSNTIIDKSEDLYRLNIARESGLGTPEGSITAQEIGKAINSFNDDYREPFKLYVAGYKYSEIAEKMSLPLGTIKSRIFLARRRLQVMLKDYR